MRAETIAEASRLRLERERLLQGDFILSPAHWRRLAWIRAWLEGFEAELEAEKKEGDA